MRDKTIKRILRNKMNSWMDSVNDNDVKEAIKRSAIVTGGSIVSLIKNEEVNDFDVYFKNPKDLLKVVRYYVSKKGFVAYDYDGAVEELLELDRVFGGVLTDEENQSNNMFEAAMKRVKEPQVLTFVKAGYWREDEPEKIEQNTYQPLFITDNAVSLSDKLQIVTRFTGDVEKIHENFDFVHATSYYDFYENNLVIREEAAKSIRENYLYYIGSLYPITSIIRSKKFIKRGWNIGAGEYLKMAFQISELDLQDVDVLSEQLIGVDIAYFAILVDIIREKRKKDPNFTIDKTFVFKMVEKIFNEDDSFNESDYDF